MASATTKIAAIVVTYDRSRQLQQCLAALGRQSRPVDRIYVIDNHARDADGSNSRAADPAVRHLVTYLAPPENLGGAGGFCLGIQHAYADGFDWLWLLDDDAVPDNAALHALLAAYERAPASDKPLLLASRVTWTDGRTYPGSVTYRRDSDRRRAATVKALGYASIRSCTFISTLIARRAVALYGYPIADYFIWGDDLEYTSRILRRERGFVVPDSRVNHQTANDGPSAPRPFRIFLFARNYLWMLLYSRALSGREKFTLTASYAAAFVVYLIRQRGRPSSWWGILRGFAAALARRPGQAAAPLDG